MSTELMDVGAIEARPDVAAIQSRTEAMIARAEQIEVADTETAQVAADFLIAVKGAAKHAETLRKSITEPLTAAKKNVDAMFGRISRPCGKAEKDVKGKLGTFREEIGSREKIPGTNGGTVSFKEHSSFKVVDPALVPDKYRCVDEKLIGEVVRGGVITEIPGVEITTTVQVDVRT